MSATPAPMARGVAASHHVRVPPRLAPASREGTALAAGRLPFGFARRFVMLFCVGFAMLLPAWWNPHFALLMLGWDLMLVIAWAWDLSRLPGSGALTVERRWHTPLTIGRPAEVEYAIEHTSTIPLRVELADDAPPGLAAEPPIFRLDCPEASGEPRRSRATARITIVPPARGDRRLGRALLRIETPLRFAQRRLSVDLGQTVRVYPDRGDTGTVALAALRSRQLELERRRQRFAGVRREFEALREWRDGDELRDVCWPASARSNRLVSKQWRAERSQTVWIVLDAGRLMGARAGDRTRLDVACDTAVRLARVAEAGGDRIGLLVYGRKVRQRVAPGHGRLHMRSLLDALSQATRETSEADHVGAALQLLAGRGQRSLVVWITDVAETAGVPDVITGALQLARRHLVLFLAMGHGELAAAAAAPVKTPEMLYRRAAALELALRRSVLLRTLRHRGVRVTEAEPGDMATAAINGYLNVKERSRL